MNSPHEFEMMTRLRQQDYLREAAAEQLASHARKSAGPVRTRLAVWLYALARRLADDRHVTAQRWRRTVTLRPNGVEYWHSA
jgi:hypothetical protein